MTNPTSITMNEQDKQEILRGAQSKYNGDKVLFNHTYVEYASTSEFNKLKVMIEMEIRR
jgi:hypothetical protein